MSYKEPLLPFTAALTANEKSALEALAKQAGMSRAGFVRRILSDHIARSPAQVAA